VVFIHRLLEKADMSQANASSRQIKAGKDGEIALSGDGSLLKRGRKKRLGGGTRAAGKTASNNAEVRKSGAPWNNIIGGGAGNFQKLRYEWIARSGRRQLGDS